MRNIPNDRAGCTSRHSVCWCSRLVRCSAERKQCWSTTRRREEDYRHQHQQVVVPLADTPQKRDCRPSPEQVNSRTTAFRRPTLPVLVRARTGTETTWRQQKLWVWFFISIKKRCSGEVVIVSLSGVTTWDVRRRKIKRRKKMLLTPIIITPMKLPSPCSHASKKLINLPH